MIYYTSDLHFGHQNILKYEPRPWSNIDEMDKGLIERWNSKVNDDDEVWILGDLTFYKEKEKNIELVSQLKGRKHLIVGNHDYYVREKYLNNYFESISQYKKIWDQGREIILFHYPIFNWDKQQFGSYHLYGHVHSQKEFQLNIPNSYNVGVDTNDWYPVTLNELISSK